jgi:hypothetical protein
LISLFRLALGRLGSAQPASEYSHYVESCLKDMSRQVGTEEGC